MMRWLFLPRSNVRRPSFFFFFVAVADVVSLSSVVVEKSAPIRSRWWPLTLLLVEAATLPPPEEDTWKPTENDGACNDNDASRATVVGDTLILLICFVQIVDGLGVGCWSSVGCRLHVTQDLPFVLRGKQREGKEGWERGGEKEFFLLWN